MSLPSIFDYLPAAQACRLVRQDNEKTAGAGKALKVVGKGVLGFGVGTAAGYGLAELGNKVFQASTGKSLPSNLLVPAAGLVGAGLGLAYSMYKSKEQEELHDALKTHKHKSVGGDSGK
mgnify:CR=1 FL=1